MEQNYICKYCGRICKNANSKRNHERLCKMNPDYDPEKISYLKGCSENIQKYNSDIKNGKKQIWNKGKTKNTDSRIKIMSEKVSESLKGKPSKCKGMKYNNSNGLSGGIRHGAGRGKKGRYKGIWCDSSWELAYLIYCLDHGIKIERCTESFDYEYEGQKHKYFPDFIVEGTYIEIKGFNTDKVQAKIKYFPQDKAYKILYNTDLSNVFNYVKEKYGKDFIKLYEH